MLLGVDVEDVIEEALGALVLPDTLAVVELELIDAVVMEMELSVSYKVLRNS